MTLIMFILTLNIMSKSCVNESVTSALLHQLFQLKKEIFRKQRDFNKIAFRVLITKNRIFFLSIILSEVITEDTNNIKFNVLLFSIVSFINEFSDVTINVLNESERMMFVSDDVVLNCCREIWKFSR